MRAEGLRVGLYFSLIDWHHPGLPGVHRRGPALPLRPVAAPSPEQWARYSQFMFGQVRELLTDYGRST